MKLFILVLVFVTMLALASDNEDTESKQDEYEITIPEKHNKDECVVVEVCDSEGNCDWRITCP